MVMLLLFIGIICGLFAVAQAILLIFDLIGKLYDHVNKI
jgi:hypothetical protein